MILQLTFKHIDTLHMIVVCIHLYIPTLYYNQTEAFSLIYRLDKTVLFMVVTNISFWVFRSLMLYDDAKPSGRQDLVCSKNVVPNEFENL